MKISNKINIGFIIFLCLWCCITILRVFYHSPWYDEAHAWLISQDLNLFEIIKLMKIEGHTFLWYLCIMPFAKTNFMYPYSMLLINWLFCFVAILILWIKSPFNNITKILISFSFPFLTLYPVVARCYSIGIMFLFILVTMEKSKLKHPNWYSLCLILCANTSVMAAVGATAFGLIFLHKLIKAKSRSILPLLIMFTGAFLIIIQLTGSTNNIMGETRTISYWVFDYMFISDFYLLNLIILIILFGFYAIFYIKNRILPSFMLTTYLILAVIFCIYPGNIWHWFFFFIYLIISSWLCLLNENLHYKRAFTVVLCIVSTIYIFYKPSINVWKYVWQDNSKTIAKKILQSDNFKNSNFILLGFNYYSLIPYFKDSNITIYNYCSGSIANYDTTIFSRSKYCYQDNGYHTDIEFSALDKVFSPNKINFTFRDDISESFKTCNDNSCFYFNKNKIGENKYLYLITKGPKT